MNLSGKVIRYTTSDFSLVYL